MTATVFCTAPSKGHKSPWTAALCPVHRPAQPVPLPDMRQAKLSVEDRIAIARNPDLTGAMLEDMLADTSLKVRVALAGREELTERAFVALANDRQGDVRAELLRAHHDVPADIVGSLCDDDEERVRFFAYSHPSCPVDKLNLSLPAGPVDPYDHDLLTLQSWRGAARNPNTPPHVLAALARIAASRDSLRLGSVKGLDDHIVANPNLPPEALSELARAENTKAAVAAAANPRTPLNALERLAEDRVSEVRAGAASNPNLPLAVARRLFDESHRTVDEGLASNPALPEEMYRALFGRRLNVGMRLAENPGIPASLLVQIYEEATTPREREAVQAQVDKRICALGIDEQNISAIDYLRDLSWWNLTPESDEVALSIALFANP